MTPEAFRAMSLEELDAWLTAQNAELAAMYERVEDSLRERVVAYRVLKEKMGKVVI